MLVGVVMEVGGAPFLLPPLVVGMGALPLALQAHHHHPLAPLSSIDHLHSTVNEKSHLSHRPASRFHPNQPDTMGMMTDHLSASSPLPVVVEVVVVVRGLDHHHPDKHPSGLLRANFGRSLPLRPHPRPVWKATPMTLRCLSSRTYLLVSMTVMRHQIVALLSSH